MKARWLAHSKADRRYLRAELATARRDGAADALSYAGTLTVTAGERDRLYRLAEDQRIGAYDLPVPELDRLRDEALSRLGRGDGTRPVPGSPEPAGGGDDADPQ